MYKPKIKKFSRFLVIRWYLALLVKVCLFSFYTLKNVINAKISVTTAVVLVFHSCYCERRKVVTFFVIWCHLFPFFNSFILPLWSILLSRFGRRRRANLRTRLTLKILQRGCFCMRSVIMEILFLIFRLFWPYFVHHNSFLDVRYTIFIQSQWTRTSI